MIAGQAAAIRISRLEEEVETLRQKVTIYEREARRTFYLFPHRWGLSHQQAHILSMLMREDKVSSKVLFNTMPAVFRKTDGMKIGWTQLARIRPKLRVIGAEITNIFGYGYFITPEHKALIRQAIEAEQ